MTRVIDIKILIIHKCDPVISLKNRCFKCIISPLFLYNIVVLVFLTALPAGIVCRKCSWWCDGALVWTEVITFSSWSKCKIILFAEQTC